MPDFSFEDRHGRHTGKLIAGVDEAGRGPLAGPVVAAAVIIGASCPDDLAHAINDSKKLTLAKREQLFPLILQHCITGIAQASAAEIDRINILQASLLAMARAVEKIHEKLQRLCDMALIDGNRAPKLSCACETIVGGDARSVSIAAASILAKVTRDRIMKELHEAHPHYGWDRNAGYPTAMHCAALETHGITPHHRTSFAPVRRPLITVA